MGDNSDSHFGGIDTPVVPVNIDPDAVTTNSLQALQSADQRKVMDIVDRLRRTGLSGVVELPQLIVCGDQSSGKSSVLEAITEIPFPRKENLCTRFATEIILRRSTTSTSTITITPDKLRPHSEQTKLKEFTKSIENFDQLPGVIEEATIAMGLGVVGVNSRAFSRDVLSVEITGPNRPQLTLVDLPGLIHATNKAQTETDKELILNLVGQYMKNPRTIILAVVSAKNDFANQIILDHCRKIDEQGCRTLGIITKPDYLRESSENELAWIDLAQNKDIYLERGWHMLKNRGEDQMKFSFDERNKAEDLFFSKGRYANLPRDCVGISSLRDRLSKVLLSHLIKELPSLKEEMVGKLQATLSEIEKLGEKRNTSHEQRMVLIKISMEVSGILNSATKGSYESSFFGLVKMDAAVDSSENIRRFRAVIQHLNMGFAKDMRLRGHKFAFESGPGDEEREAKEATEAQKELEKELSKEEDFTGLPVPKKLTRKEAVNWVKKTLERSRGYELPGTFQPMLISQLFWEQSKPWEELASLHIAQVAQRCKEFVDVVINETAPPEFKDRLMALNIDAALSKSLADAKDELRKILKDKNRHPCTYNHYFTTNIQKMRQRKHQAMTKVASAAAETTIRDMSGAHRNHIDRDVLATQMNKTIEPDMDVFSSQEALDTQRAYYKDELKYFVNNIAKAVIERHLVEPLPDIILSPLVVTEMTDQQVEYIAAEPLETTQQRTHLEARKVMLEKGLETFRDAMGGLRR
ncbi:dynamin family protein [Stemphylium lycopersici]|uniref:Dynamin family protein n=1 Tax=Stemphylium lycopersici TaxID=183478 RepID=A0A364N257_STELY|nr:dynamin family protein [Stemphylium lycopersici]RAR09495.1 dynamin family protein [Stemphylium lycopersici]